MRDTLTTLAVTTAVVLVAAAGCGPDPPATIDRAESGSPGLGEEGSYGVGWIRREFRVRVDQNLRTDVFYPLRSDGRPASGPFPVVVGVQGGSVSSDAYRWLYKHIASRGFVVVAPENVLQLAIFSTGNAAEALHAVRRYSRRAATPLNGLLDDSRAMVIGHSLGGVVASKNWLYDSDTFSHLAIFAGWPESTDDFARQPSQNGDRVLSVIGGRDARNENGIQQAKEGADRFQEPTTFAIVRGMNHYQWGDLPSTTQLSRDAAPTVDTDVARDRFKPLFDAFLQDFEGRSTSYLDEPGRWPTGVVTWRKWNETGD